ncbi:DUF5413 family protein [Bradyrhizobium sp. SYSU BS000235]|uniref:DUF5413 family protein n=1 Tax=Bradyrhizobium sp. SYSU BS000235 TaxID=3411332 RepID=UPI003C733A16
MRRYVIFILLGPFIGGFLLLVASSVTSGFWQPPVSEELGKLFKVFFLALPYSYLFGFIPAAMTGAVDDILFHIKSIGPNLRLLLTGAFAFVATLILYGTMEGESGLLHNILYGVVGFVPATLSSWLSRSKPMATT